MTDMKLTDVDADKILTALDKTSRKPRRIVKYKAVARAAEKLAGDRLDEITRLRKASFWYALSTLVLGLALLGALITLAART